MSRLFDGTDDTIAIANESNFDFERTDSFSVCCWANLNILRSGGAKGYTVISKLDSAAPNSGWEFFVAWNDDSIGDVNKTNMRFWMINNFGGANRMGRAGLTDISNNIWNHLAWTYDGSSAATGVIMYINGIAQATYENDSATLSSSILNNIATQIGSRNAVNEFGKFNGLSHMHVYRRTLQVGELNQLMRVPKSITNQLIGYWPLWGISSSEPDLSGNKNFGTVTGAIKGASDPPINGIFTVPKPELIHVF